MNAARKALNTLFLLAACNAVWIFLLVGGGTLGAAATVLLAAGFLIINVRPAARTAPTGRIRQLEAGAELLKLFLITATINTVWMALLLPFAIQDAGSGGLLSGMFWTVWIISAVIMVLAEAVLFWNGMIRVYLTSVQLGIRHRVLAALCGWIPGLNIWYLCKVIRIAAREVEFETQKWELDQVRAESEVCKTKYPLLLVHGVFFRDFRYLSYWGRIPRALLKNGAVIYYGQQQSAASVEECGAELAERIQEIVEETGCEKVNIIAHSKGGLDSRAAISHFGCDRYVASLTTINTPHRGCIFAEYLLNKAPEGFRRKVSSAYNAALKKLGDREPDFLAAVTDLTETECLRRNEVTPDMPGVFYQSVMSYCEKAGSGKFPLNVSYPVVKHFDGQNDGLVSVDSARWGERFTLLEPSGGRGISHGDVIDLNRENIQSFDVREFYVQLAAGLKERGL
ncbi:triacylglycerol lipase [Oscillibacter hominis]|uniref:Triacylglycerol lipase n=1 Tax=Oscillibacter hominis TaxID=2763056 RepID=A0A7G9B1C7_9FIRM|nr:triacylglycerol lipase [Oscillibacter hominis]QNL43358.1 triacylglycerol lipase [Oscillibacter hominis]